MDRAVTWGDVAVFAGWGLFGLVALVVAVVILVVVVGLAGGFRDWSK